jgi:DNA-binding CsgD family transcriptional regulator
VAIDEAAPAAAELVGRDSELSAIAEALTGPAPLAVTLEGEAGIGKTALWHAGISVAEGAGRRVVVARPGEAETTLAHAALGDLLGPLAGEEAMRELPSPQRRALDVALLRRDPGDAPLDARAVGAATAAVLGSAARGQPLLLAVDDVQWLDPASAAALRFAVRRLDGAPVKLFATERTAPGGQRSDLGFRGEQVLRLPVTALDPGSLQALIRGQLGTVLPVPALRRIAELSGGNPYYALGLARAAARRSGGSADVPEIPDDIGAVLRDRLEALPAPTREALGAVAALGSATVAAVAQAVERRDLDPAFAAGVLHEDGDAIRFEHPLLAETAYGMVPPSRRRETHLRLAGIARDPEERARHLAAATTEPDAAVAAAIAEGGGFAAARGAPAAAAGLLEVAARVEPDPEIGARRLLEAGNYFIAAGDGRKAIELGQTLVDRLAPGPLRARALIFLADQEGPMDVSLEQSRQALEEAGDDVETRIDALLTQAMVLSIQLRLKEAFEHARRALDLCGPEASRELRVRTMTRYCELAAEVGGSQIEMLREAAELEGDDLMPDAYWGAHGVLGRVLMFEDDLDGARPLLEERYERAALAGDDESRAGLCFHLAELECRAGRFEAARLYADEGLAIEEASYDELAQGMGMYVRSLVATYQGDVELARSMGERGLAQGEAQSDALFALMNRGALGFLELSLGDYAAAHRRLSAVTEEIDRLGIHDVAVPHTAWYGDAFDAEIGVGNLDEAERLIGIWEGMRADWPRVPAITARARAQVAAARGELDAALEHAERALANHEGVPLPFERARTLIVLGTIQRRAKHKAAARAALEEAVAALEGMGVPLWAERARAELGRIGGRSRAGGLTPTEQRVADLVAEGMSNKQVAEALFVSVRTVEANLTRVYAKLGVRSRTELASRHASGSDD